MVIYPGIVSAPAEELSLCVCVCVYLSYKQISMNHQASVVCYSWVELLISSLLL